MHARFAVTYERGTPRRRLLQFSGEAGLEVQADRPGMLVLADSRTRVVAGPAAIAIGQLFESSGRRLEELDAFDGPAGPVPGVWGNFATFAERPPSVYRDPSGSVSVYQVESRAGAAFVSDAEVAGALGLLDDAPLDSDFMIHWLQFPYLRSSRTGIATVVEILPGARRQAGAASWTDELAWKPWDHAGPSRGSLLPADAARALREISVRTIASQLRGSGVLLQLSGGLDSSIVAACLGQDGIGFTAVNFATRSADGDERRYARAAAEMFGATLIEIEEEEIDWSLLPPAELRFRPGSNPILEPLDRAIERNRSELGLDTLVDGGGGDNLFGFLTSAAPVLDALLGAGPAAAWRTIGDVAERADCSPWAVAGHAALRALALRRPIWREDRRLLNRDRFLAARDLHPWLDTPRFAFPAKRDHVAGLVEIHHFLDRRVGAGQAVLHPLMAQPLLERCLSIPSWQWVRGGIDRAIARTAFRELLPAAILERRTKGSLQGLVHRAFAGLHGDLRDLLLGGELRRQRIVDPAAVEGAFASDLQADDEIRMRLTEMAALELWLRSWLGRGASRRASQ